MTLVPFAFNGARSYSMAREAILWYAELLYGAQNSGGETGVRTQQER